MPKLSNIKNVIPIASGKGGVGKSTVSANLAVALAGRGYQVGLMDADVYGPSIPTLMAVSGTPKQKDGKIEPLVKQGVKIISMGLLIPKNQAVIWRGPMLHKMIDDFLRVVNWGTLDYLIVDLPPGTGDVQLSLCQKIPVTGAVIVSTPQDLAFHIAEKAIIMFKKLRTPVLGIVENMSGHICSSCGHHDEIFGKGGVRRYGTEEKIPFLGEIPLSTDIRTSSDEGLPIVRKSPDSPSAEAFRAISAALVKQVDLLYQNQGSPSGDSVKLAKISLPSKEKIVIRWSDGSESHYRPYQLRLACTCAQCVDETTGTRKITEEMIKRDVFPISFEEVGQYGLSFHWSDKHSAGIYTFDYLRSLSQKTEEVRS